METKGGAILRPASFVGGAPLDLPRKRGEGPRRDFLSRDPVEHEAERIISIQDDLLAGIAPMNENEGARSYDLLRPLAEPGEAPPIPPQAGGRPEKGSSEQTRSVLFLA